MLSPVRSRRDSPCAGGSAEPSARAAEPPPTSRRLDPHVLLLGLVLVVAAVLRLAFLASFPEVEADEGLWTNSTKNFLLFGDWFMDGRTHVFLSPAFHGISLLSFWVLGPSIEAARLVSAVAGVGSVALLYLLVLRVAGDRWLALAAAAVLALDPWAVVLSRRALVESLQVLLALGAAAALARPGRASIVAGGALFAMALLAKLNVAILGIVLALFLLLRPAGRSDRPRGWWKIGLGDAALFGLVALGIAGGVYGALYLADPERFVQAFRFEMAAPHFVDGEDALLRAGRWGLAPLLAARSTIALIRLTPFLFAFAAVGAVIALAERRRGTSLFLFWAILGLAFPLVQLYQPERYFFFAFPGLAVLAALLMVRVASGSAAALLVRAGTVAVFVAFSGAYVTMNFVANRGNSVLEVESWVREHVDEDARLLVAGYYATNVPNPAFARYHVVPSVEDLLPSIRALEIDYVIWDEREWHPAHLEILEDSFERVHSFDFGYVYRTGDMRDGGTAHEDGSESPAGGS
jgi:4-amino-4-deoxy-L-arabinose transferase-like glycosyltransferase